MREQTYHIYLDSRQKTTLLHSLVELKNQLYSKADMQTALTNLYLRSQTHLSRS